MKNSCERARSSPVIDFKTLRHTHASLLVQKGVPIPVIAAQLGNSARICEKHYAHLALNYISETIRNNFPDMQILQEETNIVPLKR